MLAKIVEAHFCQGHRALFYKNAFAADDTKFEFLKTKAILKIPGSSRQAPRGIQTCKKADIVNSLCPMMRETRRRFWESLLC
jgi:hypothetical protein